MTEITLKTYAKINLSLYVGKKRNDGYHDISSVMQSISLYDNLTVKKNDSGKITVSSNLPSVPCGDDNIAVKAAKLMQEEFSIKNGFDIFIEKNIPMGGGMAGGSTNAAGVLHAICELCEVEAKESELLDLGRRIGADVPFCILGGTALCEGIGEEITKLNPIPKCEILLVNPNINVSTGKIFNMLDKDENRFFKKSDCLVSKIKDCDFHGMCLAMENDMQKVTASLHPEITKITEKLNELGADAAIMSGSGSTCFGIFSTLPDEQKVTDAFPGYWVKAVKPIGS